MICPTVCELPFSVETVHISRIQEPGPPPLCLLINWISLRCTVPPRITAFQRFRDLVHPPWYYPKRRGGRLVSCKRYPKGIEQEKKKKREKKNPLGIIQGCCLHVLTPHLPKKVSGDRMLCEDGASFPCIWLSPKHRLITRWRGTTVGGGLMIVGSQPRPQVDGVEWKLAPHAAITRKLRLAKWHKTIPISRRWALVSANDAISNTPLLFPMFP